MELNILIVLCIALYGKYADGAITAWTQPVIATVDGGSGTVSTSIAENTAAGATTITIAATGAATSAAFTLVSQTPTGIFSIHTDTGILSIVTPPNYETADKVVMVIRALDTASPAVSSTATVTVSITDTNDNTPACTSATLHSNVRDGSCSATYVTTVAMTDADGTSANNAVTLSISGSDKFTIDTAGQVTVVVGKTIWYEDGDTYSLTLSGVDNGTPALTGTCTVNVYVCSAPTISVSIITLFVALLASLR